MTRALVTGSARRLGRAMALALAARGYDLALHYSGSEADVQRLADEIGALDQRAVPLRADLLVEDETQGLLPAAAEALGGPITTLINNASIFERDLMGQITRSSWDRAMESNLRAPVVLTQALAAQVPEPVMDAAGEPLAQGLAINMIDQRVRALTPDFMSYTLAKSALWTFTQTAAQALGGRIRVNAIGPGPTLQGERQTEEQFRRQRRATITGRGADPEDITGALAYFLDAKSVTGQLLCIDGGQHLSWETPDVIGVE